MSTPWFYSNTITQYGEVPSHVSWANEDGGFAALKSNNNESIMTTKELLHIANPTTNDIKMKTYYLNLVNFNMINLPLVISGIEVEIEMNRGGRITDETIQLLLNDSHIGDNQASYPLSQNTVYGSETSTWGVNLTPAMLQDPTFGLSIRYQSHPSWPHRESPKLEYIRLRVW